MSELERENTASGVSIIAEVIEQKLDNLIDAVKEIKQTMHDNSVDIANLKLDINTFKNETAHQQKEIDELKAKDLRNKGWIMGIGATLVASLIMAVLKIVAGVL